MLVQPARPLSVAVHSDSCDSLHQHRSLPFRDRLCVAAMALQTNCGCICNCGRATSSGTTQQRKALRTTLRLQTSSMLDQGSYEIRLAPHGGCRSARTVAAGQSRLAARTRAASGGPSWRAWHSTSECGGGPAHNQQNSVKLRFVSLLQGVLNAASCKVTRNVSMEAVHLNIQRAAEQVHVAYQGVDQARCGLSGVRTHIVIPGPRVVVNLGRALQRKDQCHSGL